MSSAYCPRCRSTRSMHVTVSKQKKVTKEGKPEEITVKSLHCQSCHCFVKSEVSDAVPVLSAE